MEFIMTEHRTYTIDFRDTENQFIDSLSFQLPKPCTYEQGHSIIIDFLKCHFDESRGAINDMATYILDGIINPITFQNGRFCWLKSPAGSQLPFRMAYMYYKPAILAKAKEAVKKAGGLVEAKNAVANNVCNASYYLQGGTYFRYNAYGVDIVSNGEYKPYHGHIDSNLLVHLDYLAGNIALVEEHDLGS